jgi:serine protease Do
MKALVLVISAAALLTGCATNPFAKYYQSYTNQMPALIQSRLLPPSSTPQIITTSAEGYAEEARRLEERGYVILGATSFWGFNPTREQITEQATKVGADMAIWASAYSHTEQGVRPIFTYIPGQTYTTTHYGTETANIYGTGGYASGYGTYSGTSTTTTPGTLDTQYVPYQRRIYNHGASFWRRTKPAVFGAALSPVPEDLRTTLQRNTGAYVMLIMPDSPAFKANIMRGDVVIQLADKPVSSPQELINLLSGFAGQKVSVKVLRGNQTLDIDVQLNP